MEIPVSVSLCICLTLCRLAVGGMTSSQRQQDDKPQQHGGGGGGLRLHPLRTIFSGSNVNKLSIVHSIGSHGYPTLCDADDFI